MHLLFICFSTVRNNAFSANSKLKLISRAILYKDCKLQVDGYKGYAIK
jgi:hypothetical protein